jgi:hypothetical protein
MVFVEYNLCAEGSQRYKGARVGAAREQLLLKALLHYAVWGGDACPGQSSSTLEG